MAENRITVGGRAERRLQPDVATWTLTVVAADAEARTAFDRCAERASAVVERLKAAADVETRGVAVRPRFAFRGEEQQQIGHEAEAVIVARAPVARAAEAADVAMAAGADRLDGPVFAVRDTEAAELEALADAFADARQRAERLAAAAGRALGGVVAIEADGRQGRPRTGPRLESQALSSMPVEPGELAVTSGVVAVFALEA
jgi:uncharacterized protein YggE